MSSFAFAIAILVLVIFEMARALALSASLTCDAVTEFSCMRGRGARECISMKGVSPVAEEIVVLCDRQASASTLYQR